MKMIFIFYFSLLILHARIPIPKDLLYESELPLAQKRAEKNNLPIAFIFSLPEYLDESEENADPLSRHPAGATHFAFQALQEKAVLVWINAQNDQTQLPPLLEKSLFEPGINFYYPPQIIITTPSISDVITKIPLTDTIEKRQKLFLEALEKIENKSLWNQPNTVISETQKQPSSPERTNSTIVIFILGILLGGVLAFFIKKFF